MIKVLAVKTHDTAFILFAILTMGLAYAATDIYLPAMPTIQNYFTAPITDVQHTLTSYLLGLGIAQIITGPIIDHLGYRRILIPCTLGFVLATLICALAGSIQMLTVTRAFQALFAGMMGVTARASFIKRFDASRAAHIFMTLSPTLVLSSIIAPIIGGSLVEYFSWRSNFFFLTIYSALILWGVYRYFHINEVKSADTNLKITTILKIYRDVLFHKKFMQCLLINGMYLGILFTYMAEAPFIYHLYGYTAQSIGYTFIPVALAFLAASQLSRFLHACLTMQQFVAIAYSLVIIGLMIMALPAFYAIGLFPMIFGISLSTFGMGLSCPVAFGKGVTLSPSKSGYAASLMTSLPFAASTLLTLIVHPICGNNVGLLALFLVAIATASVLGFWILQDKAEPTDVTNSP